MRSRWATADFKFGYLAARTFDSHALCSYEVNGAELKLAKVKSHEIFWNTKKPKPFSYAKFHASLLT